jgi:hypothetical protein
MNFKLLSIIMIIFLIIMTAVMIIIAVKLNSFKTACEVCEGIYGKTCLNFTSFIPK